jgi:hypothetical protein
MPFAIRETVEVLLEVPDDRHTTRACSVERSDHKQGCCGHILACPCDTTGALIGQSHISQRQVTLRFTGSQENNLPLRRYDGVTLVTGCVSVCMSTAIGRGELRGQI